MREELGRAEFLGRLLVLGGLALAPMALTACGGGEDEPDEDEPDENGDDEGDEEEAEEDGDED